MDRDSFVAGLIAALQENAGVSSSASADGAPLVAVSPPSPPSSASSSPAAAGAPVTGLFRERWHIGAAFGDDGALADDDALAREAHARLQFDFPQLTDAQLLALATHYRRVAGQEESDAKVLQLPVTNALVAGVAYLSEQAGGDAVEARGLLAAALLLLLPARCLKSAGHVRTRALLSKVMVPVVAVPPATMTMPTSAGAGGGNDGVDGDAGVDLLVEKFAAEEDPDDLSQVYEGAIARRSADAALPLLPQTQALLAHGPTGGSGGAFADKLQFLVSRTFSSAFLGISVAAWDEWGLDRCLVDIVQHLVLLNSESLQQQQQHLSGHSHGEWTRYLYILRDRVLRFPSASRGAIQALRDLVDLLQPSTRVHAQQEQKQLPHHLVYRVLAELALSKELQQRSAQPAQRELAAALHALVPRIVHELQRLGTLRLATVSAADERAAGAPAADENDDLILILTQLVHFLLLASPSKRVTADKLQESGVLRALLSLVPVDLAAALATMSSKRFWFTPLVRLVAACAVWNGEFAAFIARVPKFVALLPAMREQFPAELALLLVALYHHELQTTTAIQTLVKSELPDGSSSSSSSLLWDVFVSRPLFPLSCDSYLDSMTKLQDAVYFLESVVDALGTLRSQVASDLRVSLQRIYPSFSHAFAYPSFSPAYAEPKQKTEEAAEQQIVGGDSDGMIDGDSDSHEREERGAAESLQFIALRNKLRQCTKTILLASSSSGGFTPSSAASYSSSKLD